MIDSNGKPPEFVNGDRVIVLFNKQEATVIRQMLHHDGDESFWGKLELLDDTGVKRITHSWQVKRLDE